MDTYYFDAGDDFYFAESRTVLSHVMTLLGLIHSPVIATRLMETSIMDFRSHIVIIHYPH